MLDPLGAPLSFSLSETAVEPPETSADADSFGWMYEPGSSEVTLSVSADTSDMGGVRDGRDRRRCQTTKRADDGRETAREALVRRRQAVAECTGWRCEGLGVDEC